MSLISFTPLQDGVTGVNAAATNTPLSTIYNDYNGNITDANIAAGAAIAGSKVNMASLANPYKFSVYRNAAQNSGSSGEAIINFDTKVYDTGSNVDIVTNKGRFTVPIAGFYHFNAKATVAVATSGQRFFLAIYKNGVEFARGQDGETGSAATFGSVISIELSLAANDYVEIYDYYGTSATALEVGSQLYNYFQGFLVSAT